ncbi:hypothetical protein K1719_046907 [Acacia pycnantha]|nr:hypothetical protein K1719_046907 [Acacia pycnantha]
MNIQRESWPREISTLDNNTIKSYLRRVEQEEKKKDTELSCVYLDKRERLRHQRWSTFTSFSTMDREKGLRCWYSVLFTLVLMYGLASSVEQSKSCAPSRCGIITNISHPFRLRDDPPDCGDPIYELACENNITLLHLYSGTYRVLRINYNNYTIRLVDPGIQKGNCSSLPRYLLSQSNFTDTYNLSSYDGDDCRDAVRDDAAYLDTASCVNWAGGGHLYAVAGDLTADQLKSQCRVKSVATIASDWESMVGGGIKSYAEIHSVLSFGFELSWWQRACADFKCPSAADTCSLYPETLILACLEPANTCTSPMGITHRIKCSNFTFISKLRILAEDYLYGMEKGKSVTKDTKNKAFSGVLQKKFKLREQHKSLSRSIYIRAVHGEQRGMGYGLHLPRTSQVGNQVHQDDPVNEAVRDALVFKTTTSQKRCRSSTRFLLNDAAREFFSLMDESDRPLYQGCQKYSKLSFLIKLYHIKCMCGITDKAMSMFLELLRDAFPDADIPSSFYEAKKIINRLGLNYEK